jgi:hypothetical protein
MALKQIDLQRMDLQQTDVQQAGGERQDHQQTDEKRKVLQCTALKHLDEQRTDEHSSQRWDRGQSAVASSSQCADKSRGESKHEEKAPEEASKVEP